MFTKASITWICKWITNLFSNIDHPGVAIGTTYTWRTEINRRSAVDSEYYSKRWQLMSAYISVYISVYTDRQTDTHTPRDLIINNISNICYRPSPLPWSKSKI